MFKFGKDFAFWIQLVLVLLKAIVEFMKGNPVSGLSPGESLARSLLGFLVKKNEDDDLQGVDGNGQVF